MSDNVDPLAQLKGFQRDTVEHAFSRLWDAADAVDQFLVADEVGLGKTMVARGVVAKAVKRLGATQDRVKVVYICSNQQIARQNLGRLSGGADVEVPHADRLTMLPRALSQLADKEVSFLSFTPGTSLEFGVSTGHMGERALVLAMLARGLRRPLTKRKGWLRYFQCGAGYENFSRQVQAIPADAVSDEVCEAYVQQLSGLPGTGTGSLLDEVQSCVSEFSHRGSVIPEELHSRRRRSIGRLRQTLAELAVDYLEPDLVILDEFQNFKKILPVAGTTSDGDSSEATRLMSKVLGGSSTKVLMLSATPFSMYTLPGESDGDSHHEDFLHTVSVLGGRAAASSVQENLRRVRRYLRTGEDFEDARQGHLAVEAELRRFMCRTERVVATADRNGMVEPRELGDVAVSAEDLERWNTLDKVATHLKSPDPLNFWKSAPYALNLMEKGSYVLRQRFEESVEAQDAELAQVLSGARGLLRGRELATYERVDPANGKMRALHQDVFGSEAWKVAWLPPALPYYELGGPFASQPIRKFTKRLVFSDLKATPRSISAVTSYEAERMAALQARAEFGDSTEMSTEYYKPTRPRLTYRVSPTGKVEYLPNLLLAYPSPTLAKLGDSRLVVQRVARDNNATAGDVLSCVAHDIAAELPPLGDRGTASSADRDWYMAGALLLDRANGHARTALADMERGAALVRDDQGRRKASPLGDNFVSYLTRMRELEGMTVAELREHLGPAPDDLEDMLAAIAVGGPAVCAARGLVRRGGQASDVGAEAFQMAEALRTTMNRRDIFLAVQRGALVDYWRDVLRHCVDGCLQAVLDEYLHMLVEMEGLQQVEPSDTHRPLAEAASMAMTLRGGSLTFYEMQEVNGRIEPEPHSVGLHFAVRFGRASHEDQTAAYEGEVRAAFNSPFRPFVLTTTSVGQEGLDFHAYSHAVVHWNLPPNPVDMEQREGRVHRYKGHAIRKNIASRYAQVGLTSDEEPWDAMFTAAERDREPGTSELHPYWLYPDSEGAAIERYTPMFDLSREVNRSARLRESVAEYRLLLGQPRQSDYVGDLPERAGELMIDLRPAKRR